ncbi:MAG: AAA family ATPase [Geminicoccaceae bacterium]
MQINKLRLSGFKSFVQPTELLIEAGLTGIVGPNGCGKSNLVDALRWVMGESSAKGLRGGEMDDVIFAGTGARAAFDLAEVALQLQAGAAPIPGFEDLDELELTRRIGRGMGSVYRVNGAEVRAKDVQLLFADAASGARSASIVSQGQIGALVEAKPLARRKLLEEAAGIGGLQARRHEAELKLQAAEANLVRVEDLIVTLAEQFATLQKQARQAERYRKLQQQHRETEAALLLGRWQAALAERRQAEGALRSGRSHVEVHAERLAEARSARESASETLTVLRRSEAELDTEQVRLSERLSAVDAETARLEASQTGLKEQERRTVQDLEHAEAALGDAETMAERLKGERQSLETLIRDGDDDRQRAADLETEARSALETAEGLFRERLAARADAEARCRQIEAGSLALVEQQQALVEARRELDGRLLGLAEAPQAQFETEDGAQESAATMEAALQEAVVASDEADLALQQSEEKKAERQTVLAEAREAVRATEDEVRAKTSERREQDHARQLQTTRLADLERRIERLEERRVDLSAKTEALIAERDELGIDAAEQRIRAIGEAIEGIADRRTAAIEMRDRTKAEAETAELALQTSKAALAGLEAEAQALAGLEQPESEAAPLIDKVRVHDGHADALAAALGDDLLGSEDEAAPTIWLTSVGGAPLDSMPLPEGATPLAERVDGPAALRRRLAQVGLVEEADGERLQAELRQGQRLVSRSGGLWRWDGLVRKPDGARAASARLKQQARRRELEGELITAAAERDDASIKASSAHQALATASADVEAIETEHETERLTAEAARHALAGLQARRSAIMAELGPLGEETARLEAELAELRHEAEALQADGGASHGDDGADAELAALQTVLTHARSTEDQATRAEADSAAVLDAARLRATERRKAVLDLQERLERRRADDRREAARAQERALERVQIEAKLARLEEDQSALDRRLAEEADQQTEARQALDIASVDLQTAERTLESARAHHAQAKAEDTSLRDRHATARRQAEGLTADLVGWNERIEAAKARQDELLARRKQLVADLADLEDLPANLARQRGELGEKIEAAKAKRQELSNAVDAAERALTDAESALHKVENEQVEARESGARLEAHLERALAEAGAAETAVRTRLGDEIEAGVGEPPGKEALAELEARLARIEASRERLGAVNLRAIDEAAELEMRIQTLTQEKDELGQAIERLRRAISTLNREGRERLRAAFGEVEKHFEALFVRLFGGGRAKIELTDMEDPLNAGLELSASPPGKKLQALSLLSGGEKALTAVALIFAIFLTRPSPLCLLDEVDAPLDDANVNRLGVLLEELTAATQTRFIVVTHHPMTMARMDRLYGVTMMERGVSQLVGVDLRTAEELRATA